MKRYQECNKVVKLIRKRWILIVPFIFIFNWLKGIKVYEDEIVDGKLKNTNKFKFANTKLIWRISICYAHRKMIYYHTSDEVMKKIKERIRNYKK